MKIGIITMHKPISYGSALQAYALQETLESLGYEAEIIDYQYPNKVHRQSKNRFLDLLAAVRSFIFNALYGFSNIKKQKRFEQFWKNHFKLSIYYPTKESIISNPPQYDIYCTGSDQVWNPNFTKSDTTFLLSFVDNNKRKISYSSSFAIKELPSDFVDIYQKYLSMYTQLSVRETSGIDIIKGLLNRDAICVCDPTILVSKDRWLELSYKSKINIRKPYILVFMLGYSFNPYPEVNSIIEQIQEKIGCNIICLDGDKYDVFRLHTKVVKSAGPEEFLSLVRNATYVITSSFHGVVFSTIFEKAFTAIINEDGLDSRIPDFLNKIGLYNNAVDYRSKCVKLSAPCKSDVLYDLKEYSIEYLLNSIKE